jgi:N-acetylglucosaminyldiphosphoundecaprenol N-acetyl-beta-D-mannosaminyltransferase
MAIVKVEDAMELDTTGAERRQFLGLSVDALTMPQTVTRCVRAIEDGKFLSIGVVNAAKVMAMRQDSALRRAVTGCSIVLADGQSVVWASRLLRAPLPERVAGSDLFFELLGEAERRDYGVYFLGAKPDVLARMMTAISRQFPGLKVAGSRDGYFHAGDESEIAAEIKNSRADLLFLGISSPKKEQFVSQWGQQAGVHVAHGVGGSFDILAGITARAPIWWQRHGLEWLYRAWQEPLRLGPRYLKTNASFMGLVALEAVQTLRRRPGFPENRYAGESGSAVSGDDPGRSLQRRPR